MKYLTIIFLILFYLPMSVRSAEFRMLKANRISGLIPDIEDGYGTAFRDFNRDGLPDIYIVCFRNLNRFLINNGGIIPFIDRTIYSGLGGNLMPRGHMNLELGASAADYDNDGLPDIFLSGWGKTKKLFRNRGHLLFDDVTANLQLHGLVDANQALWLDADNDGQLDLYITDEHHSNRLLFNLGNGEFKEKLWSDAFTDSAVSEGAVSADFDLDGDADIYVANWFAPDYLLLNNGQGMFEPARISLSTLEGAISTNSAACGDVDNDGDPDLFVAGQNGRVYWYRNDSYKGHLRFTEIHFSPFKKIAERVYGILIADFNQDGWLDLFFSVKGINRLYLNNGRGSFDEQFDSDGQALYSTGCAAADLENDGDLDILVANKNGLSQIFLNPTNNQNFIKVYLTGVRSNRDAFGARVRFYAVQDTIRRFIGSRGIYSSCGYLSSADPVIHLGTGGYKKIQAEIIFPSGKRIYTGDLIPGHTYHFNEFNIFLTRLYFTKNYVLQHLRHKEFWIDLFLILLLLSLIYFYSRIGQKRYSWQATEVSTQLIFWFVLSLILFVAMRALAVTIILVSLNVISVIFILSFLMYSERQYRQRQKRLHFVKILQEFSNRILTVHDTAVLYRKLKETLLKHDHIKRVDLYHLKEEDHLLVQWLEKGKGKSFRLTREMVRKIQRQYLLDVKKDFQPVLRSSGMNVLLPLRQDETLLGVIGLQVDEPQRRMVREVLQSLIPIANQVAIAIANNNFVQERERLVQQLTEAEVRQEYLQKLEKTNKELDRKNAELTRLFEELRNKESQLVHSEKMASLGHLVAGISHELNNPISFIYANSMALQEYVDDLVELWEHAEKEGPGKWRKRFLEIASDLQAILKDNLAGSRNVKQLVLNLKNFSRLDQAEWKEVRLSEGLESSLHILQSQIPDGIIIKKEIKADPPVYCNPSQMNQVFLNLLSNAVQAIEGKGQITITTSNDEHWMIVQIADTGKGISPEVLPRIFDPFFTTKEVNKGTGLGLSISYTIVKKHGGEIDVQSEVNKGTIFTVRIPLSPGKKITENHHRK